MADYRGGPIWTDNELSPRARSARLRGEQQLARKQSGNRGYDIVGLKNLQNAVAREIAMQPFMEQATQAAIREQDLADRAAATFSSNGRTGGGGYARPAFDETPFNDEITRIENLMGKARGVADTSATAYRTELGNVANTYNANVAALRGELANMQAQAAAKQQGTVAATQQDLAQQGVDPGVLAQQAANQQQMQAEAAQRQQDYVKALAAAQAQSTADKTASGNTMFEGIKGESQRAQDRMVDSIRSQMEQARAAYNSGGGAGGGGRRGGGGGGGGGSSSGDMTESQLLSAMRTADGIENYYEPTNLMKQYASFDSTLYGPGQAPVKEYLTQAANVLASGDIGRYTQMQLDAQKLGWKGKTGTYNKQVLLEGLDRMRQANLADQRNFNIRRMVTQRGGYFG